MDSGKRLNRGANNKDKIWSQYETRNKDQIASLIRYDQEERTSVTSRLDEGDDCYIEIKQRRDFKIWS